MTMRGLSRCLSVATFIVGIFVAVIIGAAGGFAYVVFTDSKTQTAHYISEE
jgi:hypothetical protein